MPVVLNVILEALITLLLLLHAYHALLTSPTPNRQLDEARLTWGQSKAVHGSEEVRRLGSKRRREGLAKELSGLLIWGAYLAMRSWADATLSWIIPFYGSLKTLWLFLVLVNSNVATWLPYRYALEPVLQRHEAAIDTAVYWLHGLLVYLGHLALCAGLALTPQILIRFYDRCRRLYGHSQPRGEEHPLDGEVPSPNPRSKARTPRPTPRLPGALSLTPTPKSDTPAVERNVSATSTSSREKGQRAKSSPPDSPTLTVQAQKVERRDRPGAPSKKAEVRPESPCSDGKRKRGNASNSPSTRERNSDSIDTPSKRGRKQQAPFDEKSAPQITRVGRVYTRINGAGPSQQAGRRTTRAPQATVRAESRHPAPPSQLPRAKRAQPVITAERSKARRLEQDARPGQVSAASASKGRTSTMNRRATGSHQTSNELGTAPRTRSQSRRTVD